MTNYSPRNLGSAGIAELMVFHPVPFPEFIKF